MKRLLILLTLLMFTLPNCTNTSEDSENIFNNNENTTQDKTEEEEEQKEITLTSSKLTNVTIKTPPVKTEYTAGETFAPAGLYLQATYTDTYSDGTQKENIEFIDCETGAVTFTGTDFAEAGTATVTVTYKGKNVTFSVKVTEKPAFPTIGNYKITGEDIIISDFSDITVSGSSDAEFNISFLATKQTQLSLPEISNIAKAFPNATITADDKISYTINGGTKRGDIPADIFTYNTLVDNEFKDLTTFAIEGKILIDETTDVNSTEHYDNRPVKIRTITLDNGTTLNITGKYLDIGRNRFKVTNNAVVNLSDDIEITTYDNSENSSPTHANITSDIANTQFDALGLTTPNFDLAISDENLYNFAHNILDRYDSFDKTKHKLKSSSYFNGNLNNSTNVLYTGDALVSEEDRPTLKFSSVKYISDKNKLITMYNLVINNNIPVEDNTNLDVTADFTNIVFEGDFSNFHNKGSFEGISHFMGNPMQGVSNSNGYVKVDYVDTNVGEIFGDIIDLTDLSDDIMYDIGSNRNMMLGGAADVIGIFRDEKQQVAAENIRKKGSNLGFKPVYLQDNPKHKNEFIKTLADWEVEYNSSKKLQSSNTAQQ
ncbi:MAG: bacterial Ig-like domain-containing protein [Spirochaetales bacterium]|nr:bacterial Ig-like domain-containing protein [Spirochaetales bacterium]